MRVAPQQDIQKRIEQARQKLAQTTKYGTILYEKLNPGKDYREYTQHWDRKSRINIVKRFQRNYKKLPTNAYHCTSTKIV